MIYHYRIRSSPKTEPEVFHAETLGEAIEQAKEKFKIEKPVWTGSSPCMCEGKEQ
jgi:hypothetical protein